LTIGAAIEFIVVGGLQAEAVLEGDEVEQSVLGLDDEVRPVSGGEQVAGAGDLLAPGGGVPAGSVEGDGQMQRGGRSCGHGGAFLEVG
jgi:hypothetical protein